MSKKINITKIITLIKIRPKILILINVDQNKLIKIRLPDTSCSPHQGMFFKVQKTGANFVKQLVWVLYPLYNTMYGSF